MNLDYEKRYKEALENASIAYKDEDKHLKATLERIFPELKESEDERIRKELIAHFRNTRCVTEEGAEKIAQWVAWLENQGKKQYMWTDNDRVMAFTLLRDVDQMTYISDEGKNERLQWLNSLENKFNSGE